MMRQAVWTTLFLGWMMTLNGQDLLTEINDLNTLKILTPSLQNRETAKVKLENGITAYLVSDPEATQSAASLAVEAGSWHEPKSSQGLAHFLEHMLFLGTSKYPEEGEYARFVKEHGGTTNAYTAFTHTNYMFSIHNGHFEPALDRFSWFFKEPLFNPSGVEREMNAVDQEFKKDLSNDTSRGWMVLKELTNEEHPFSYFHYGNLESLGNVKQSELKAWYQTHYSPEKMHLVLYSNEPMETLKKYLVTHFASIEKKETKSHSFPKQVFSEKVRGAWTYIQPVKDLKKLSIYWELPAEDDFFKAKDAGTLLGQVLGHEGEESLLAQLKREGLAETLSAGFYDLDKGQPMFMMSLKLTEKGLLEKETVLERVFEMIRYLKETEMASYLYHETNKLANLSYQYQSRIEPFPFVRQTAAGLIEEDIATYPEKTVTLTHFDRDLIRSYLNQMTPENGVFTLMVDQRTGDWEAEAEEKWMKVPYKVAPFSENLFSRLAGVGPNVAMALPGPNPFIPEELNLEATKRAKTAYPSVETLSEDAESQVYSAQDSFYQVPEGMVYLNIKVPRLANPTPTNQVLAKLYIKSVKEKLNAFSYPAKLAGLDYSIGLNEDGFEVMVSGYDAKAKTLLIKVLETLKEGLPTEQKFEEYKRSLSRSLRNFSKEMALYQGVEMEKKAVFKGFYTNEEKARAIEGVTLADLIDFHTGLFDSRFFEGFIFGNFTGAESKEFRESFSTIFKGEPFKRDDHFKKEVLVFPNERAHILNVPISEGGNAGLLVIQNGEFSHKRRAIVEVFENSVKKPFFEALRTQQQTGYIVFNQSQHVENQLLSWFGVQSATHDPRDLLSRFELFIEEFLQSFADKEEANALFERVRASMIQTLEKPPENIDGMGNLLVSIAFDRDADFDWVEKRRKSFEELEFEEYVKEARALFGKDNRKRLAILVQEEQKKDLFYYAPLRGVQELIEKGRYTYKNREIQALIPNSERIR